MRNKGGKTATEKIFNNYVLRYGFPRRLHHDQGQEFECNLMKCLQQLAGMKLSRTTPYHPQGNGQAERWNRTILSMLQTLTESQKANWKDHVDKAVFAYNCTRNDATGYSPFYLLYGRYPCLPIDIMFGIDPDHEITSYQDYVLKWKRGIQQAFELASQHAKKRAAHSKQIYDRGLYGSQLTVGDRVLVRNLRERGGPGKLRSYWEEKVHEVVAINENSPVYSVKAKDGTGKVRVLHRNLLLPCDYLPLEKPPQPVTSSKKSSHSKKKSHETVIREAEDESSDDEESLPENFLPVMLTQDLPPDIDNSTDVETCSLVESEPAGLRPTDQPESEHEAELQEPEVDELEPELNEPEETQKNDENLARRPKREQCPPSVLMYDRLGQPVYHRLFPSLNAMVTPQDTPLPCIRSSLQLPSQCGYYPAFHNSVPHLPAHPYGMKQVYYYQQPYQRFSQF